MTRRAQSSCGADCVGGSGVGCDELEELAEELAAVGGVARVEEQSGIGR